MQRIGAMGVVPVATIISFLLVASGGGGGARHCAAATTTSVLGFTSAAEVVAYWQAVLPQAPMPSAIMDRITAKPSLAVTRGEEAAAAPNKNSMPLASASDKILFPEDVFAAAGSVIDLYIDSSATLRTACKSHEIAHYIPMSAEDLADIRAKYALVSVAMARDIWSTLNACDGRLTAGNRGERLTCTASIRTMVEFAASVLGTRHLRAFSSSRDVPAEGITALPSPRYRVVAVRPVTTAPTSAANATSVSMTCHSMEFPSPAYYCHAVNPTRVYEVTLWREARAPTAAPAPRMMRALAVCHLDSSGFDPNMSFFVDRGIKPGDAPACHFLSRRSVLWAPADAEGTAAPICADDYCYDPAPTVA